MEDTHEYDLCVLGCGPGGFAGAMRAFDFGAHVCIVEAGEVGGTGVQDGALASKTMWELAKDYSIARRIDRGYSATGLRVNFKTLMKTVEQAVKERQYQMLTQLETFSPQRWKGEGSITLRNGWAQFHDSTTIEIKPATGNAYLVRAKNFLIATGSRPRPYLGIEVDQKRILDSDGIKHIKRFPKRLLIVGAGVIGCEYATIFSSFGHTQVYLVDHKDRVLPYEDGDVSRFVHRNLEKDGVKIYQSATLRKVEHHPDYLRVFLDFPDKHSEVLEVDNILFAVGRKPNLENLKLDNVGVKLDPGGYLCTGSDCRVAHNVFACGDVTCHPNLVNIAEMEGRMAAKVMFAHESYPLNYRNMSVIMFLNPSIATVGLSEEECQAKGYSYKVGFVSNAIMSRPIAMRNTRGFVKIIVHNDVHMKILGMRAGGPQVSNVVTAISHFMDHDQGAAAVLKSVYPHPSISEVTQECLRLLLGKSVYKPQAFPDKMWVKTWIPAKGYVGCGRECSMPVA
ncbi:MAG: NAD(P)/FAD-dependent oxidoreductase [Desulfuromonadaceae bacterium]|nr:NAD(P)/FAD-dependent oxidoreductase [Desulfuromonadaceae bacterium]